MSVSKLVNNVYPGGEETFRQLFQQYGDSIYQMLVARCQNKELAREVLRNIFQDVYEELIGVGTVDVTAAWLKSCAQTHLYKKQILSADTQIPSIQSQGQYKSEGAKIKGGVMPAMPPLPPILEKVTNEQLKQLEAQNIAMQTQQAAQVNPPMQQNQPFMQGAAPRQAMPAQQPQPYGQDRALPFQGAPVQQQGIQNNAAMQQGNAGQMPNYEPYVPLGKSKAKQKNGGRVAIIAALSVMILITLWMLMGLLMDVTLFPSIDLGYTWFNANIIDLF